MSRKDIIFCMTVEKLCKIGILALQGAFIEHVKHLEEIISKEDYDCEIKVIEVRTENELLQCDALIIPGGESTTMSLVAERTGLLQPLMDFVKSEKPIWGTCAGLILLARCIENGKSGQKLLGGIDIQVKRNAFGRQLDSFQADLDFSNFIDLLVTKFPTVFIRAPIISEITPEATELKPSGDIITSANDYINKAPVEILHQLDNGLIVAVRQGNKLGTSFHPELSNDYRFHKWFLDEFIIKHKVL